MAHESSGARWIEIYALDAYIKSMDANHRLEDLMLRHALGRRDLAQLLGKPLNSAGGYSNSTIDRWLSRDNPVPVMVIELLELKLAGRTEQPDPWQRLIRQPVPYADQRELERDLVRVMARVESGDIPRTGRLKQSLALRRAGYWMDMMAHLGGLRLKPQREALLAESRRLREKVGTPSSAEPVKAGDRRPRKTLDDLARKWGLAPGADVARFRQLARTGHV